MVSQNVKGGGLPKFTLLSVLQVLPNTLTLEQFFQRGAQIAFSPLTTKKIYCAYMILHDLQILKHNMPLHTPLKCVQSNGPKTISFKIQPSFRSLDTNLRSPRLLFDSGH